MSTVLFVAGARPNFIKVAPLLRAAAQRDDVEAELIHTGQHYDAAMSGVFADQLGLVGLAAHLEIDAAAGGAIAARIMAAFEAYLRGRPAPPRAIVVVGDVDSTMACAAVGARLRIPVVHVEAGLRSGDRAMPEEVNRIVTDAIAARLLVSEPAGLANLAAEGVAPDRVRYVGNVMIDSLVAELPAARALDMAAQLGVGPGGHAVVTLHRPSNVDRAEPLAGWVRLICDLGERLEVVFPIHPRTERQLAAFGLREELDRARVHCIAPQGYREFLGLVASAHLVVTDSGGIQEETTFLSVPCVTLRTTTERPVTVTSGTNVLVGDRPDAARVAIDAALAGPPRRSEPIRGWDGHAAPRALDAIAELCATLAR